jgi:hypothetical protein
MSNRSAVAGSVKVEARGYKTVSILGVTNTTFKRQKAAVYSCKSATAQDLKKDGFRMRSRDAAIG